MKINGHSSLLISDYIIHIGGVFDLLHLNRLVFISHGRHLTVFDKPLIHDRVEAWQSGPIISLLYHELKIYTNTLIDRLHYCKTMPCNDERNAFFENVLTYPQRVLINEVKEQFGSWESGDLQKLLQEPNSPWDMCYDGKFGTEIPDKIIRKYYNGEVIV